ncbi:MAG: hypothetical protein V4640_08095 [Verrucomicrobiota bacterium]
MKPKNLVPLILACLALPASAFNEETTRLGDELVTLLQAEQKALAPDNNQAQAVRQYLRQVQSAITQSNGRVFDQYLDNLGNYEPSEKIQRAIDAFKNAVRKEFAENTHAVIIELRGIIDGAREAVTRATEPDELDKLLVSLSRNRFSNSSDREEFDSNDSDIRALLSEMSNARQFVTAWQDYLQASNSGDTKRAIQQLRNMTSQDSSLIPRSKIIARIEFESASPEEIAAVTASISNLDAMKGGIEKLSAMIGDSNSSSHDNTTLRNTVTTLTTLEKTYREHLAGLPVSLSPYFRSQSTTSRLGQDDFLSLRADLLRLILPRCLDLPDELHAQKDESVDDFLKRALQEATARGDTATARRIQDCRLKFVETSVHNQPDLLGLEACTVAQTQLAAGQTALAVVSFYKALASGSDLVPAADIGKTLTKIEAEHPKEFEKGMQQYLDSRRYQDAGPQRPRMPNADVLDAERGYGGFPMPSNMDPSSPLFRHLMRSRSGREE